MKVVVRTELVKSVKDKNDKAQLEYFKKELIKILAKKDSEEVSKAIEEYDASLKKAYTEIGIEKAGYGIGTVRVWKGQKFRKIAPGKWRRIYDSNTRGANQSIAILRKKIQNAQSIDELLQLVMENTNRFMDAEGKLLPIVDKLNEAVKASKTRLNAGKPSTQDQIEQFKKENGKSEEEQYANDINDIKAAFDKITHVDIDKKDFEGIKAIHDKATDVYGNITKKLREAEDAGDWSKVGDYENLKDDIHSLLSRIQWWYNEAEKNYTKEKFFEGIEGEKDFKRTEIADAEDSAISDFNNKVKEFVEDNRKSSWAVYTNLLTFMKNVKDKKAAQRWCVLNNISNFDELQREVEHLIRNKNQKEEQEKHKAEKAAREEKINKINENNVLKTYTPEEINEALKGVLSLMSEREQLITRAKDVRKKEFDARARYDEARRIQDENRNVIWDEVKKYRDEANKIDDEIGNFEKKLDKFMNPITYYYLNLKYKKDETINNCKTIEEVENLIKSKDWYEEEGKKRLNLKGMEVKGAKEIFKCMERLFAIFPEEKGRKYSMICTQLRSHVWACAGAGEIKFSIKHYSNYEDFEASYNATEGNFHPKGTTAKDVVYHEYYHVLTSGIKHRFGLEQRIKQNVTKRLKMRGKKGGPKQDDIIKYGVSEYATTNAAEFGAECFCQALGSENPSAFAIEVFKETLKFKKYMRGIVS